MWEWQKRKVCARALLLEILVEGCTDLGYSSVGVLPNQKIVIIRQTNQQHSQQKVRGGLDRLAPFILSLPSQ